jgi:phage shock protein PspC (stress-responsive transcriptional regulator)
MAKFILLDFFAFLIVVTAVAYLIAWIIRPNNKKGGEKNER